MSGLPRRQLGKDGPMVAAIGFGAMGLSSSYGKIDDDEQRYQVLDRALSVGSTFWDTSDVYGDSEELIGKWLRRTGNRDKVFIATKFGVTFDENRRPLIRSDPEYVKLACSQSLKRLGVETIDLYYCHRVDRKTPIEKTVQAMAELKSEGKIKAIGLSEISAGTLRRAHRVHPIAAVQVEYSPFALDIEHPDIDLLKTCRDLGIAVVAYSPLGRGFLTGQLKSPDDFEDGDFRRYAPRYSKENFPKNLKLVKALEGQAEKSGCTSGQLSLAWLLALGEDIIPIPGTKKIKYLDENVASIHVKLSTQQIDDIRREIEDIEIVGDRYPAAFKEYSYADTPNL
ncbi:hypothetical protein LTR17_017942 [Elasticomyces elasticus]|nr:hypothetical protein LTR17_017942 [Elasticomyces elasticus]